MELTQAFQGKSDHPEYVNKALVSLEREFVFVRSLETMVVLDRIQMASPDGGTTPATSVKGTFVLHTETTPTVQDPNHLLVVNGTQALRSRRGRSRQGARSPSTAPRRHCGATCRPSATPRTAGVAVRTESRSFADLGAKDPRLAGSP